MTKYREYRYCNFYKQKVPFCVQADIENKQLTIQYLSCDRAPQCGNTNCKWSTQETNTAKRDYILMD